MCISSSLLRLVRSFSLLTLVAFVALPACEQKGTTTIVTGATGGDANTNGSSGTTTGSSSSGTDGSSGSSGSNTGSGTSDGSTDQATGTDGATWTNDTDVCGLDEPNLDGKPIGAKCTTDEECSTGYCYNESIWNENAFTAGKDGANRFCTVGCSNCGKKKTCSDWPSIAGEGSSKPGNKCYPLPQYYINHFKLQYDSVCFVACYSDADCEGLGPYSSCRGLEFGKDTNYGSPKVCQPDNLDLIGPDEFE